MGSVSSAIILALRDLADGSFEMAAMRDACAQFGQLVSADTGITTFLVPDGVYLNLCVADDEGLTVGAAIVTVAAWDTLWPREDAQDRVAYDAAYDRLLSDVIAAIDRPDLDGVDSEGFPFRWSLWRGSSGVMVVQQSCYDYTPDINIWIRPHGAGLIDPDGRFVEWLMAWS